jgi:hypothetical protein
VDLKEINPVEVDEYAASKEIQYEPDFAWWVPHTIKKWNRIIATATKRYQKRNFKFGSEVPNTWAECLRFDKEKVNKEMKNVRILFKIINGDDAIPPT